jgi:hypothetical protein
MIRTSGSSDAPSVGHPPGAINDAIVRPESRESTVPGRRTPPPMSALVQMALEQIGHVDRDDNVSAHRLRNRAKQRVGLTMLR